MKKHRTETVCPGSYDSHTERGFSLLEIAIIVAISATLAIASLTLGSEWLESEEFKAADSNIDKIEKAFSTYRRLNYRLPCPASMNAIGTDNMGMEASSPSATTPCEGDADPTLEADISSETASGIIPFRALGLSEAQARDPWGNYYKYYVDRRATRTGSFDPRPNDAGPDNYINLDNTLRADTSIEVGEIEVRDASGIGVRTNRALMALVSHGKNDHGAVTRDGTMRIRDTAGNLEVENAKMDTSGNTTGTPLRLVQAMRNDAEGANQFDDLVHYMERKDFFEPVKLAESGFEDFSCTTDADCSGGDICDLSTNTCRAPFSCTAPYGANIAHGASATAYNTLMVPNGSSCSSVSETRTCDDGNFTPPFSAGYVHENCSEEQICGAQTVNWSDGGINCEANLASDLGELDPSVVLNDSSVPGEGQVEVSCFAGSLSLSNEICNASDCSGGGQTWNVGGNSCSAGVGTVSHGGSSGTVDDTSYPSVGSASFSCNNGTLTVEAGATCETRCEAKTVSWSVNGVSCSAEVLTEQTAGNTVSIVDDNTTDPYKSEGGADVTCQNDGSYAIESGATCLAGTTNPCVSDGVWTITGNSTNLGSQRPRITRLDDSTIAFVDRTVEELRTYRWDGTNWAMLGSGYNISSMSDKITVAGLNHQNVVTLDVDTNELRTLSWDGSSWSMVGSGLDLGSIDNPSIARLTANTVAVVDDASDTLRTYQWDGSTWFNVGSTVNVTNAEMPDISALNNTTIVYIDNQTDSLQLYEWSSNTWSTLGSAFDVSDITNASVAALDDKSVVLTSSDNPILRTYKWDGAAWSQLGSASSLPGAANDSDLATLDFKTTVFVDGTANQLQTYTSDEVCPTGGSCPSGGVLVAGSCWYQGNNNEGCDAVCSGYGMNYDPATATYAGAGATQCQNILDALTAPGSGSPTVEVCTGFGVGCHIQGSSTRKLCTSSINSTASGSNVSRACACIEPLPCPAQAFTYNACTADFPETADGVTTTQTGPDGDVTAKCNAGAWEGVSETCGTPCLAGSVTMGTCTASFPDASEGTTFTLSGTDSTGGTDGTVTATCSNGIWSPTAETCKASCSGGQSVSLDTCNGVCNNPGGEGDTQICTDGISALCMDDGTWAPTSCNGSSGSLGFAGPVYAWGFNNYGQLGDSSNVTRYRPVLTTLPSGVNTFTKIGPGGYQNCVLGDNTKAYCFGDNTVGELGIGNTTHQNKPVPTIIPSGVSGYNHVETGNNDHACAITTDGEVYCWGLNNYGMLGTGNTSTSYTPRKTIMPAGVSVFVDLEVGWGHTCGIGGDGNAYCWGFGGYGQIGDGNNSNRNKPTKVQLPTGITSFTSIASGAHHNCAISNNGRAYCWGWGGYGQLGNNEENNYNTPQEVEMPAGVTRFTQISAGTYSSCALDQDGIPHCWGYNVIGQLGTGNNTDSDVPMKVVMPSSANYFKEINIRGYHACGIDDQDTAYCWGWNGYGQLGDNTTNSSNVPKKVDPPSGYGTFRYIDNGERHTIAVVATPICNTNSDCQNGQVCISTVCQNPPDPCPARTLYWSVGSASCKGDMPAIAHNATRSIDDTQVPTLGTLSIKCKNGGVDYTGATCRDIEPNLFDFVDTTTMNGGNMITSNSVTVNGFTGPLNATLDADTQISVNGGSWSAAGASVNLNPGNSIRLRIQSSATINDTVTASITLGTLTVDWKVTTIPVPVGGYFFVLTRDSFVADMNGLSGADDKCLNDLQSYNWKGKTDVVLNSSTVRAWLCTSSSCRNALPNTEYTFARSGSTSSGGDTFTTDGDGRGPGNNDQWDESQRFGIDDYYWTGRDLGNPTRWPEDPYSDNPCSNWNSWWFCDAVVGRTGGDKEERWAYSMSSGSASQRLVCLVEHDASKPDSFSFSPVNNAELSTDVTSGPVTVTGFFGTVDAVAQNGAEISVNGGAWSAPNATVQVVPGDIIELRVTSSSSHNTTVTGTVSVGSSGSVDFDVTTKSFEPTGCTMYGDVCSDGTVYAFQYNGDKYYTDPSDNGNNKQWANNSEKETNTGADSNSNGYANQQWIENNANVNKYPAFKECYQLSLGGHSDWFLPSRNELKAMQANKAAIGGFQNEKYWTSSEEEDDKAWAIDFDDGSEGEEGKDAEYPLRCVRK